MDESEMNSFVYDITSYYYEHGWNKTLKLIKQIQKKEGNAAKQLLEKIEDYIADSKNEDLIYFYAKDVEGADLQKLNQALKSLMDTWGIDDSKGKAYLKMEKYSKIIEKMIDKSMPKHCTSTKEMKDLIGKL